MSEKIKPTHCERSAYVYIRQSTLHQVRHHLESQRRQYNLEERARDLGFQHIVIVDDDLGRSGTGSMERPGFVRLLAAVCSGKVGAVLAVEASRLARNNRDWHHLLDLCAMTATLVIDHDGVYDPSVLNDRLLLGLKGTMSEFEVSLLHQRALEAYRQKVYRGKILTQVPIGYIRTEDDGMEITPDRQVQEAIRGVFRKFQELGSIRQVLLWYSDERVMLPTHSPEGKVLWQPPVYTRLFNVLKNPTYGGAFVYGRTQTRTKMVDGRARKSRSHLLPQDQWKVIILNHHEGYISWEQYMQNQKQIQSNAGYNGCIKETVGAAKGGPSLLAGLLRCGKCGHKVKVQYEVTKEGLRPRYLCEGDRGERMVGCCLSFGGTRVDHAVAAEVLEAIRPLGIQAALAAWDRSRQQKDEKRRSLELALEKARYEAGRIERQYQATEPENRLVAAELEKRWNHALAQVGEMERRLEEAKQDALPLSEEQRQQLMVLGDDLERAWDHPSCPIVLKKRILRTVLHEIMATTTADPPAVVLKLHWAGGTHTELVVTKNRSGHHGLVNSREVIDLIGELSQVCDDKAIVSILNRLGYKTGVGNTWNEKRVQNVRHSKGFPACPRPEQRRWLTMEQAAAVLEVSSMVVRRLIAEGALPAKQIVKFAPWMIERSDLELPTVRNRVQRVQKDRRFPLIDTPSAQTPLFTDSCEV